MQRRILVFILTATALGLGFTPSARAFDTGPHTDVTTQAMQAEGFGAPAAEIGGVNNYFVDLYSQAGNTPYSGEADWFVTLVGGAYGDREHWSKDVMDSASLLHFDDQRLRALTDTAAAEREWLRLRKAMFKALQNAKATQNPLDLLTVIGASLHPVQDFYAHTNWVEPAGANSSPGWAAKGQGSTPTWFDVPKAKRDDPAIKIVPGSAPDDARSHNNWQADGNLNLATGQAKDWPGRPMFSEAYMASYFASRQWLQAVRSWLGDDALWLRAQRYASNLSALRFDKAGAYNVAVYVGHWSGEGGPCKYVVTCGGSDSGLGGSLFGARWAANHYFEDRPGGTALRRAFYRLLPSLAVTDPVGVQDGQVAVPSSRPLQETTRFVRARMTRVGGLDLGDIGPDEADIYGRASINGHPFVSAMIQSKDVFRFPKPYGAFTFIEPVTRGALRSQPIETMTVRIKTSGSSGAGTDDDVYLRTGTGTRFSLDKALYDDFERGDDDTYSVPIDELAKVGFRRGDLRMIGIEKSSDGALGGWKLGAVTVKVNGITIYSNTGINKWLEDNHRTWQAPDFQYSAAQTDAVPIWMDLKEDDITYGADDQGDVNPLDARNAIVRGYRPGAPAIVESVRGGRELGGRINRGGDYTRLSFVIDTLDPILPAPSIFDTVVGQQPVVAAQQDPPPTTPAPTTPPGQPDLVVTEFLTGTFTVKNQGTAAAGASKAKIGTLEFPVPALAAGTSIMITWNSGCSEGTFLVTADALGVVTESNEANNTRETVVIC